MEIINNETREESAIDGNSGEEGNGISSWQKILLSLSLFIIAGLFEIGGGYLVWIGCRGDHSREKRALLLCSGSLVLIAYGFIPTLQPSDSFGRTYAVYGGFFIVLSYCWSVLLDDFKLDSGDYIGGGIALIGVCIAWFWPR